MGNINQDWSKYPVTVFHLDDQRSVTKSVKKKLKHVPHLDFHECNDPNIALEQILNIGPTVILLDLLMPITSGYDILRQLNSNEATQDIPVLILTTDNSAEAHQKAFELGADDYLIKVPDKTEMIVRLRYHTRSYIDHLERIAIYNALLETKKKLKETVKKLKRLSLEDNLTGIPNRRAFDQYFEVEWQRAMRETTALSLLLIDVDFFKQYNDFYGHLAGDDCLRNIAQGLKGMLQRPSDLLARYGGEEFIALLPNTDALGAIHIAEKLRLKVISLNLEHRASDICDVVTVSIGVVTTIPMIKHQPRDYIHAVDNALYAAKKQGRNRTVCKSI